MNDGKGCDGHCQHKNLDGHPLGQAIFLGGSAEEKHHVLGTCWERWENAVMSLPKNGSSDDQLTSPSKLILSIFALSPLSYIIILITLTIITRHHYKFSCHYQLPVSQSMLPLLCTTPIMAGACWTFDRTRTWQASRGIPKEILSWSLERMWWSISTPRNDATNTVSIAILDQRMFETINFTQGVTLDQYQVFFLMTSQLQIILGAYDW